MSAASPEIDPSGAAFLLSQPGLGTVLAARVLGCLIEAAAAGPQVRAPTGLSAEIFRSQIRWGCPGDRCPPSGRPTPAFRCTSTAWCGREALGDVGPEGFLVDLADIGGGQAVGEHEVLRELVPGHAKVFH
jgi:hypothetical protein